MANAPVCISKHFVYKLGVRSTSNNTEFRAIEKCSNREFLQRILKKHDFSEEQISFLSEGWNELFISLKWNMKNACKTDFKEFFIFTDSTRDLSPVSKVSIADACCFALLGVLPPAFFGHAKNVRLFKRQVRDIVHSMRGQHLVLYKVIERWRMDRLSWCARAALRTRRVLVYELLLWIYRHVLSTVIAVHFFVTTTECSHDETRLYYFAKRHWQRYHDDSLRNMLAAGVTSVYEPYSYSKLSRKKYSHLQKIRARQVVKSIPKLYIVLKNAGKFRPIVWNKSYNKNVKKKKEWKTLLKILRGTDAPLGESLELQYTKLYKKWVELKRPKLYFVRADLTNAFGSIDRNLLLTILSQCHKKFQEREQNLHRKKKVAMEYRALAGELRSALLVRCGSTVYRWNKGLVQGVKFSPALSDIYYAHLDRLHFSDTLASYEGELMLFRRVVDDYLYVSDSLDNATRFINDLSKYENLNLSKTVTNFIYGDIRVSENITFLGYVYDTSTLEVVRSPNALLGQICYKTVFSQAVTNLTEFIRKRIGRSGIPVDGHVLNLHYNSEKSIWLHSFTTLCLAANKFCTILSVLCDADDISNRHLNIFKKEVGVRLCNAIVETVTRNKPADVTFRYCINHFRHLAYKALLLCTTQTKKCTAMVPEAKALMSKTNCTVGRWRPHSSAVGYDGVTVKVAVVEVCRRDDFRMFLRSCDTLPVGFECHNHSHLQCEYI